MAAERVQVQLISTIHRSEIAEAKAVPCPVCDGAVVDQKRLLCACGAPAELMGNAAAEMYNPWTEQFEPTVVQLGSCKACKERDPITPIVRAFAEMAAKMMRGDLGYCLLTGAADHDVWAVRCMFEQPCCYLCRRQCVHTVLFVGILDSTFAKSRHALLLGICVSCATLDDYAQRARHLLQARYMAQALQQRPLTN